LPHELSLAQEHDLKMELADTLYTKGLPTTSEAAAMVGIERRTFIEQMGKYGFSVLATYTEIDFEHDVATLHHYFEH
jgi:hypothetical protein